MFVDSGTAGSDLSKLRTDLGAGLRIGISRAPRNLFRLDVAYALDPDPRGERGWIVSFSSGQAFVDSDGETVVPWTRRIAP